MNTKKAFLQDGGRLLLIFIFAYAAISKVKNFRVFQVTLARAPLTTLQPRMFSLTIVIVEFATVMLLFIPGMQRAGFWVSLILLITFTLYIAYLLMFSANMPCTCGGFIEVLTWPQHLVFNLILCAVSGYGLKRHRQSINTAKIPQ